MLLLAHGVSGYWYDGYASSAGRNRADNKGLQLMIHGAAGIRVISGFSFPILVCHAFFPVHAEPQLSSEETKWNTNTNVCTVLPRRQGLPNVVIALSQSWYCRCMVQTGGRRLRHQERIRRASGRGWRAQGQKGERRRSSGAQALSRFGLMGAMFP